MRDAIATLKEDMELMAKENAERMERANQHAPRTDAKATERGETAQLQERMAQLQERQRWAAADGVDREAHHHDAAVVFCFEYVHRVALLNQTHAMLYG